MPVAIEMNFRGATLDQYDQVIQKMGLEPGGPVPEGALFHWVAKTDDGIRVVDVWETQERFDRFSQEQIQPFTQEAGIPAPPEIRVYPVHNYLTGR